MTLKIKNLESSISFYCGTLGMTLVHKGNTDAYLEWGDAWICLLEREKQPLSNDRYGMDHIALSISELDFFRLAKKITQQNIPFVRKPIFRGGGYSMQFLDPDGILLEYFTGTLSKRMENWNWHL